MQTKSSPFLFLVRDGVEGGVGEAQEHKDTRTLGHKDISYIAMTKMLACVARTKDDMCVMLMSVSGSYKFFQVSKISQFSKFPANGWTDGWMDASDSTNVLNRCYGKHVFIRTIFQNGKSCILFSLYGYVCVLLLFL